MLKRTLGGLLAMSGMSMDWEIFDSFLCVLLNFSYFPKLSLLASDIKLHSEEKFVKISSCDFVLLHEAIRNICIQKFEDELGCETVYP